MRTSVFLPGYCARQSSKIALQSIESPKIMSMSILRVEDSSEQAPLPSLSMKRLLLLLFLGLCVFGGCVIGGMRVFPGPYREIDYMMIGTGSVIIALVVILVAIRLNRRN